MKCGSEIVVRDELGTYAHRFVAQCEGRYLMISNGLDRYNGMMLPDWRYLLRELVTLTVPDSLRNRARVAQSAGTGAAYVSFPLTYPLTVTDLARLIDVPADDVRRELADLAVQTVV